MCELKVLKEGKTVFENAVYARVEGNRVTVRDVLGVSKVFANCVIAEVDISKEQLLLMPTSK